MKSAYLWQMKAGKEFAISLTVILTVVGAALIYLQVDKRNKELAQVDTLNEIHIGMAPAELNARRLIRKNKAEAFNLMVEEKVTRREIRGLQAALYKFYRDSLMIEYAVRIGDGENFMKQEIVKWRDFQSYDYY